jgi:NitT/TauT family transport system ATP-binding protein
VSARNPAATESAPWRHANDASIRFDEVSVTFRDGTHALDAVSLRVDIGELVSLVGPSGCGKSTLLRLVAGFEAPTSGSVTGSGEALGYVFQDATLLPWRSILDNVALPAQLAGVAPDARRQSARDAIRRVGLAGFERHRPAQLSGGMRMRASIARALTRKPKVFLFDEPFGALDEITRERLNEELLSIFVAEPFAGLFVTHSVPESVFLSSRVVVMSARPGRVVADVEVPFPYPRPPELRYHPDFAQIAGRVSAALRKVSS